MSLVGPLLSVLIDGTVTLQGRLDLNAVGQSGNFGVNTPALKLLSRRIPAIGPIPLSLIAEVSSLLANQVVRLQVTGTVRNPTVQLAPIAQLTTEAVRFFINRANLPLPGG